MSVLSYIPLVLVSAFSLFWAYGRVVAYFLWDVKQAIADFNATLIPDSADPSILKGFSTHGIEVLYFERLTVTRVHVASGALLILLIILQLSPFVRTRSYRLHYFLGGSTFLLFFFTCAVTAYQMWFLGMVQVGLGAYYLDVASFVVMLLAGAAGSFGIQTNNVVLHRRGVILASAAALTNPVQRFFWVLLSKVLQVGGPYKTFQQWTDGPAYLSCLIAGVVTFGAGIYYAFAYAPLQADLNRGKARIAKAAAEAKQKKK